MLSIPLQVHVKKININDLFGRNTLIYDAKEHSFINPTIFLWNQFYVVFYIKFWDHPSLVWCFFSLSLIISLFPGDWPWKIWRTAGIGVSPASTPSSRRTGTPWPTTKGGGCELTSNSTRWVCVGYTCMAHLHNECVSTAACAGVYRWESLGMQ